uniref:Uncharacterized protein n=1 Tax=Lactuca sativa TaxID=4236 RepID=A0A9R1XKD3_LACSA|nr:hypothetical protein LSAT_V11C300130990 [Lactuca sativa]
MFNNLGALAGTRKILEYMDWGNDGAMGTFINIGAIAKAGRVTLRPLDQAATTCNNYVLVNGVLTFLVQLANEKQLVDHYISKHRKEKPPAL